MSRPEMSRDHTPMKCGGCGKKLKYNYEKHNRACRQCVVDRVLNPVTRFEVIDHRAANGDAPRGRVFVVRDIKVELSYQDNGQTLKVFVTDRPEVGGLNENS